MIDIALLDTHPVVHKGFKSFFRKTEHIRVVKTFSDPDELSVFMATYPLHALVLEMELEGESAVQLIKKVKKISPQTKIIIYTALPQSIYGISLLKAGAAGYLSKKVSRKIMIEAIEKVVANGYHITSNFSHEITNNIDLTKPRKGYETLSPREVEVLKLLIEGKRNIEISAQLKINQKTVNTYKKRLMTKLEVENMVDLFQQARNFQLL